MFSLLLVMASSAQASDVIGIPAGETKEFTGPGVYMPEARFRAYASDSRQLETCFIGWEDTIKHNSEAKANIGEIRLELEAQFKLDEQRIAKLEKQTIRLRHQRNMLTTITVGLVTGVAGGLVTYSVLR